MQNRYALAGLCAVLAIGGFGFYRYDRASQFSDSYAAYAVLAAAHGNAAFIPTVDDNPLRQELNRVLVEVLAGEISDSRRLELAQRGLLLLDEAEKQIDTIGERGEAAQTAIVVMEDSASGRGRTDIVALARERISIISDIRGLSYRANFYTAEIFNRVIRDGGKLTAAHTKELNDQTPVVEEQFDLRANLYTELESTNFRMEKKVAELSIF